MKKLYILVIIMAIAVGFICIFLSGCASTGYHGSYTCPICGAKIFQYKDTGKSIHKQGENETDSKQEPFINIKPEIVGGKIGG